MILADATGTRAAAEYVVHGEYLATAEGLPAAHGQTLHPARRRVFHHRDGKIARVTNYYNLPDWLDQVSKLKPHKTKRPEQWSGLLI